MFPHAVAFLDCHYNRYSLAVLTGILEADEDLQDVDLLFLDYKQSKTKHAQKNALLAAQLTELARRYDRLVLALSFTTANIIDMAALVQTLRTHLATQPVRNLLIVAGGAHPSGDPVGTLQIGVDAAVVGEGEITFPALLKRYFAGQSFTDLQGLSLVDADGRYRHTGRPPLADISDFPPFATRHRRHCPIEISRGCPWGCYYCQTPFVVGRQMRHRSLDSLMRYVEHGKQIGLNVVRFIAPSAFAYGSDDGRTVNLPRLETMLKTVSGLYGKDHVFSGSFPSEVRPEQVSRETLELIRIYCANTNLVIGAQSGSDRLLEQLHRGHGVAEVLRAAELTLSIGFIPHLDFIFGLPGETLHDREDTLALMTRLTRMGARIHSHTFMPLVGTPLSHSQPGAVDAATRRFVQQLRGQDLEHGYWQQQERLAQATTNFLARQRAQRPAHLQDVEPSSVRRVTTTSA